MLSLGNLSTQVQFKTLWQNLQLSSKPQFLFSTHLNLDASHGKIKSGFCLKALKTQKKVDFSSSEMDGPDDFDDGFSDIEDDGEYQSDDDEVVIPLENMKRWVENRPRGFGEGKSYDTSIEDKLMEEIEQSKMAQLANVNNLKHNPLKPGSDKETSKKDKGSANIPEGFGVRLVNLPKKKNIHRDLRLAFQGVPGLLNIVPVVAGNEKTRDPVCKGLAFIYFKSQDEARRFVQNFSDQKISFGKNQKKITCEMMDRKLTKPQCDQAVVTNQQSIHSLDKHLDTGLNKVNLALDSHNTSSLREHHDAEETSSLAQSEDDDTETESKEISSTSESNVVIELEPGKDFTSNSTPLKRERKPKPDKKVSKQRKDKSPKLNIPGSANRLKVRDKAMLTDVFSKYGSSATLTVNQHSK